MAPSIGLSKPWSSIIHGVERRKGLASPAVNLACSLDCSTRPLQHTPTPHREPMQREWWVLPICGAGGHALTSGSSLGFNVGGTH